MNDTQETQDTMSASIAKLAQDLSKAQGMITGALKESNNHFNSKYADIASVWQACREPLSKNNLAVVQTTSGDVTNVTVITMLVHASGEWIKGSLTIKPGKPDAQGVGSAITYARRYGLAAIVGVAQVDDDGNAASVAPAGVDFIALINTAKTLDELRTTFNNAITSAAGNKEKSAKLIAAKEQAKKRLSV